LSAVTIGIAAGLVVGLIAATLIGIKGDESSEAASGSPRATNVAAGGGLAQFNVDCSDPRGDVQAGQAGIPVSTGSANRRGEFEVSISCAGLQSNAWTFVGPNLRPDGREVKEPNFGYAHMFKFAEDNVQPHPNTMHVYFSNLGGMTVELKPKGNENYRSAGNSNVLGIKLSVDDPSPPPKVTVDCLGTPDNFGIFNVAVPVLSAIDVQIKCDPLQDKRWAFANGGEFVNDNFGRLGFFPDRSTLRLYPAKQPGGDLVTTLKPMSGQSFKSTGAQSIRVRLHARPYKIYAFGDSWTAAFGYYGHDSSGSPKDGEDMSILALPWCRPGGGKLNDRCSSNSPLSWTDDTAELRFSRDYGLKNNISWAARVAHAVGPLGQFDFKNFGVSGAEPIHLMPGGILDKYPLEAAKNADLTLMTLGGNPMLSDVLIGGLWDCDQQRWKGQLAQCARALIDGPRYDVVNRLADIYKNLLFVPTNHVVVSSYMTIVPYAPANTYAVSEWEGFARELNDALQRAVDKAKREVPADWAARLYLVPPIKPATGMARPDDVAGVRCRRGDKNFNSDGPSVMTPETQLWLNVTQGGLFCGKGAQYKDGNEWKDAGNDVWFNSQDLGTHLSRRGNEVLANAAIDFIRANHIVP